MQPEVVAGGAGESVWCQHSLECHVVEWLLDAVEAAKTGVGMLVCSSLEPDGGFSSAILTTTSLLSGRNFIVRVTIWPEFSLSALLTCTFVLNTVSRGVLPVLRTTTQCTRCWCAETWRGGAKNNEYGAKLSSVELTRNGSTRGAGSLVNRSIDLSICRSIHVSICVSMYLCICGLTARKKTHYTAEDVLAMSEDFTER